MNVILSTQFTLEADSQMKITPSLLYFTCSRKILLSFIAKFDFINMVKKVFFTANFHILPYFIYVKENLILPLTVLLTHSEKTT